MLKYRIFLILLSLPGVATAQDVRSYQSRAEALFFMLPGGLSNNVFIGDPFDEFTNCNIGARPIDLTGDGFIGPIGENLSRHCDGPQYDSNVTSASSLGGGFFSLQPVRTISVPTPRSGSAEDDDPSPTPAMSFLDTATFYENDAVWWIDAGTRAEETPSTEFGAGTDGNGGTFQFGVATSLSPDLTVGVDVSLASISGTIEFNTPTVDLYEPYSPDPEPEFLFSDICGLDGGGAYSSDYIRLGLFGARQVGASYFEAETGISRTRSTYASDLCIVANVDVLSDFEDPGIREVMAGTIQGKPTATSFDASIGYRREFGQINGVRITPSAKLNLVHTWQSRFSETETAAGRPIVAPGLEFDGPGLGNVDGTLPLPTGTTMVFESATRTSLVGRIGLDAEVPFDLGNRRGMFRIGGAVLREFGDGQERRIAQFVEDGRDDPLRFSFLGMPMDRNWGELSVGILAPIGDAGQIQFGASTTVGHDFRDIQEYSAVFSMQF